MIDENQTTDDAEDGDGGTSDSIPKIQSHQLFWLIANLHSAGYGRSAILAKLLPQYNDKLAFIESIMAMVGVGEERTAVDDISDQEFQNLLEEYKNIEVPSLFEVVCDLHKQNFSRSQILDALKNIWPKESIIEALDQANVPFEGSDTVLPSADKVDYRIILNLFIEKDVDPDPSGGFGP